MIPLRPLTVGEILDGAFSAIRWTPKTILVPSAVVSVTAGVLLHVTAYFLQRSVLAHLNVPAIGGTFNVPTSATPVALAGVALVLYFFANSALAGLLTVAIGQGVLGRKETLGSAWRATRPRIWALLGAVLLAAVCLILGWTLAIVVSVLVGVLIGTVTHLPAMGVFIGVLGGISATGFAVVTLIRWSLVIPVVMLEHAGPRASLGRSWRLVRRSFWRVLGILLLTNLIVSIATEVIAMPFALASGAGSLAAPAHASALGAIATAVGGILADTVIAPMLAGVVVLLYIDLRMRREGMDITLQAAAVGEAPGGESAADQKTGPW